MKNLLSILLILVLFSCKKEDTDIPDLAYDYYPIELGHFITYRVVDISYQNFDWDTTTYLLREVMDSLGKDGSGRNIVYLSRYTAQNDTMPWILKERWTAHQSQSQLEINQGNTIFLKMIYPPRRGQTWNGNALNALDPVNYIVLDLDLRSVIGNKTFQKTLRINHRSTQNLIDKELKEEVYARGVGLVQLIDIDLTYDGNGNATGGYSYSQIFKESGNL